jgi:hypothetical protein
MTENEVRSRLAHECGKAGGVNALARQLKVGQPYLSLLLNGERTLGPKILKALGLRKVVSYVEIRRTK